MNTTVQRILWEPLSMSDEIERALQMQPLNFDQYHHKKSFVRANKIEDPNNPPLDIGKAHFRAPVNMFRNYNYCYAWGMMKTYFLSAFSP